MAKKKKSSDRTHRVLNLSKEAHLALGKCLKFLIRSDGFPPNLNQTECGYLTDLSEYIDYRLARELRNHKSYERQRNELIPEAERLANKKVRERGFDASEQLTKQTYWSEQFLQAMDLLAHRHLGVSCSWIDKERYEKYVGDGSSEKDGTLGRRASQ